MKGQADKMGLNVVAEKEVTSIGRWKKLARDKGKVQDEEMVSDGPEIGNKRLGCIDDLIRDEGRM